MGCIIVAVVWLFISVAISSVLTGSDREVMIPLTLFVFIGVPVIYALIEWNKQYSNNKSQNKDNADYSKPQLSHEITYTSKVTKMNPSYENESVNTSKKELLPHITNIDTLENNAPSLLTDPQKRHETFIKNKLINETKTSGIINLILVLQQYIERRNDIDIKSSTLHANKSNKLIKIDIHNLEKYYCSILTNISTLNEAIEFYIKNTPHDKLKESKRLYSFRFTLYEKKLISNGMTIEQIKTLVLNHQSKSIERKIYTEKSINEDSSFIIKTEKTELQSLTNEAKISEIIKLILVLQQYIEKYNDIDIKPSTMYTDKTNKVIKNDIQNLKKHYFSILTNISTLNEAVDVYIKNTPHDKLKESKRLYSFTFTLYEKKLINNVITVEQIKKIVLKHQSESIETKIHTERSIDDNSSMIIKTEKAELESLTPVEIFQDNKPSSNDITYGNQPVIVREKKTLSIDLQKVSQLQSEMHTIELVDAEPHSDNNYKPSDIFPRAELSKIINLKIPYQAFKEMRNLEPSNYYGFYSVDIEKLFYKQAKFMANFEDNYMQYADFVQRYSPTYRDMDDNQLRTYFTWRTKLRNGEVQDISISYISVFMSEIANKIGIKDYQQGIEYLVKVWQVAEGKDYSFDRNFLDYLKSYYLYHVKKMSYEDFLKNFGIEDDVKSKKFLTLLEANFSTGIELLNEISPYKIISSKFYLSDLGFTISECIPYVFESLKDYFSKSNYSFREVLLSQRNYKQGWQPFRRYVFRASKRADKVVRLGDVQTFYLKDNSWLVETTEYTGLKRNPVIGTVLKHMEMRIREKLKYRNKIKSSYQYFNQYFVHDTIIAKLYKKNFFGEKFFEVIDKAVDKYFTVNAKKFVDKNIDVDIIKPITFDVNKFDQIRSISAEVREKLVVEEIEDEHDDINTESIPLQSTSQNISSNDVWSSFVNSLLSHELYGVKAILVQENISEKLESISNEKGIMLEVILESINIKAYDIVGDNIIDTAEDTPHIYEEYLELLEEKIMLRG